MSELCKSEKQKARSIYERAFAIISLTMSYFHTRQLSTIIGAKAFHGPVRDGKEWVHLAMVIKLNRTANSSTFVALPAQFEESKSAWRSEDHRVSESHNVSIDTKQHNHILCNFHCAFFFALRAKQPLQPFKIIGSSLTSN